ncbi:hypothetical protein MLD38_004224 [Melastoma candidum]|uniref:Uncharacterized protein n=1 Tax=Melastoma candidum TaxID=119954 RepID=A0ACB9S563_9MYRT|nr:hypothetical protein MLD38_004224 [Melastoma candidum]
MQLRFTVPLPMSYWVPLNLSFWTLARCGRRSRCIYTSSSSGIPDEERKASMDAINPKYVLCNYLCQSSTNAARQGDYKEVRRLLKLMERPYEDQPGMEKYARLPPAWAYRPGLCTLSCSS